MSTGKCHPRLGDVVRCNIAMALQSAHHATHIERRTALSRLLSVGHTHRDDGTELYHVAEGRGLMDHPGSRRDVWAPATNTRHKELGNQSGGEDFVLRFVPKQ